MPVISRILSVPLRIGEVAFGAVVAGIIGSYLANYNAASNWPHARFIYTEIVAGLSILLALLWILPFAGGFFSWPIDLILSFAWFAAFGLLVNFVHGTNCGGSTFDWSNITHGGVCNRWRTAEAFSFLSAILWLASTLLGLWFLHRERRKDIRADAPTMAEANGVGTVRRPWYRRRRAL